jgi:aspartyl-tRNA(Asn)/glutamyl-tRNA(Gln) amidotransferase subunit C
MQRVEDVRRQPGAVWVVSPLRGESAVIGVKEVEHVAKLARLALSEEEKTKYAEQLAKIIDYFDQLKSVDTTGIEPLAHAQSIFNVMRDDEVVAPAGKDLLLENAPEKENGYFRVPRIGE